MKYILISLVTFTLLTSCAGFGTNYQEKRAEFIEQCTSIEGNTLIKCLYAEYNTAVTALATSVGRKHTEGTISDKTKESFKSEIIKLNEKIDTAYNFGNVSDVQSLRGVLDILRTYLEANVDPEGKVQL